MASSAVCRFHLPRSQPGLNYPTKPFTGWDHSTYDSTAVVTAANTVARIHTHPSTLAQLGLRSHDVSKKQKLTSLPPVRAHHHHMTTCRLFAQKIPARKPTPWSAHHRTSAVLKKAAEAALGARGEGLLVYGLQKDNSEPLLLLSDQALWGKIARAERETFKRSKWAVGASTGRRQSTRRGRPIDGAKTWRRQFTGSFTYVQ